MAKPICEVIARLDASQPVNQPVLVASLLDERTANRRGAVLLLAGLAAAGLFIALTGIYGIVAASVVERTREVGIRIAVGAGRSEVLRLLLWQGAKLILIGAIPGILAGWFIMLGLPGAPGFGGDSVFDTLTGAGVILVIGSVGLLATFLPARRATKIDPMARYVM